MVYSGFIVPACIPAFARTVPGARTGAALMVGGLLPVQVLLGNMNLHLPPGVATAHNVVAALLLVSLIFVNFRLWRQQH